MIIHLSPSAIDQVKKSAKADNKQVQPFIEEFVERLFNQETMYILLSPIPPLERIQAITAAINSIVNTTEFYGFSLLTKEERKKMIAEAEANLKNEDKSEGIKEETQGLHLVKEN